MLDTGVKTRYKCDRKSSVRSNLPPRDHTPKTAIQLKPSRYKHFWLGNVTARPSCYYNDPLRQKIAVALPTTMPMLSHENTSRKRPTHQLTKSLREKEGVLKSPAVLAEAIAPPFRRRGVPSTVSSSSKRRVDTLPEFWSIPSNALSAASRSSRISGAPVAVPVGGAPTSLLADAKASPPAPPVAAATAAVFQSQGGPVEEGILPLLAAAAAAAFDAPLP